MKRIILVSLVLSLSLFANNGKLVDVISENILKVEENGKIEKIHLAGINIFANIKLDKSVLSYKTKDNLRNKTILYIKRLLQDENQIKYHIVDIKKNGIKKVWISNHELNYKLVRDGYAVVNENDISLPSMLKMRMIKAMQYAKNKKIGIWKNTKLVSLIKPMHNCDIYTQNKQDLRNQILKEHISALPKSARIYLDRQVFAKK